MSKNSDKIVMTNCDFEYFELINGGVLYIRPCSIVSYGMDPDSKYPWFITLENGVKYNIADTTYDKFFK